MTLLVGKKYPIQGFSSQVILETINLHNLVGNQFSLQGFHKHFHVRVLVVKITRRNL